MPREFTNFDQVLSQGQEALPRLFSKYLDDSGKEATGTVYLIGWSEEKDQPLAVCMNMWSDGHSRIDQIIANSGGAGERFKFEHCDFSGTPVPSPELRHTAGFWIPDDLNQVNPEIDLLHLLEVQRHEEVTGHHWIGGSALLTSIDRTGVTQRIVHTWPEDKVGEVIKPLPINWKQWIAERKYAGLSRLQRERMMKKAAKGTLRAVG